MAVGDTSAGYKGKHKTYDQSPGPILPKHKQIIKNKIKIKKIGGNR